MQPSKKKPNRMKQQNSLKHKLNTNKEKTLGYVTNKCEKIFDIQNTFINDLRHNLGGSSLNKQS